jgi:hypothetical protein
VPRKNTIAKFFVPRLVHGRNFVNLDLPRAGSLLD